MNPSKNPATELFSLSNVLLFLSLLDEEMEGSPALFLVVFAVVSDEYIISEEMALELLNWSSLDRSSSGSSWSRPKN